MANIKFKLNRAGVRELMNSEEMSAILRESANQVASAAGIGYETEPRRGGQRQRVLVRAATAEAYYDNLENNTLLKALGNRK